MINNRLYSNAAPSTTNNQSSDVASARRMNAHTLTALPQNRVVKHFGQLSPGSNCVQRATDTRHFNGAQVPRHDMGGVQSGSQFTFFQPHFSDVSSGERLCENDDRFSRQSEINPGFNEYAVESISPSLYCGDLSVGGVESWIPDDQEKNMGVEYKNHQTVFDDVVLKVDPVTIKIKETVFKLFRNNSKGYNDIKDIRFSSVKHLFCHLDNFFSDVESSGFDKKAVDVINGIISMTTNEDPQIQDIRRLKNMFEGGYKKPGYRDMGSKDDVLWLEQSNNRCEYKYSDVPATNSCDLGGLSKENTDQHGALTIIYALVEDEHLFKRIKNKHVISLNELGLSDFSAEVIGDACHTARECLMGCLDTQYVDILHYIEGLIVQGGLRINTEIKPADECSDIMAAMQRLELNIPLAPKVTPDYSSVDLRIESYRAYTSLITDNEMAKAAAGLYYAGREASDYSSKCYSCDYSYSGSAEQETIITLHFKHAMEYSARKNKHCLFINEELDKTLFNYYKTNTQDLCQHGALSPLQVSNKQMFAQPHVPYLESYCARLETFKNWPKPEIQVPETLVFAGLYYSGRDDEVRCFQCDIGFRDWKVEDVPMEVHSSFRPDCYYVRNCKRTVDYTNLQANDNPMLKYNFQRH